jgi:hypothetical protein
MIKYWYCPPRPLVDLKGRRFEIEVGKEKERIWTNQKAQKQNVKIGKRKGGGLDTTGEEWEGKTLGRLGGDVERGVGWRRWKESWEVARGQ